jgi:hypothetical protein
MEPLRAGEPVEVTLYNSSGALGIENASFVGYDEDKAVIRTNEGKHKYVPINSVQPRGKPYKNEVCPTCKKDGKWVDHGPAVGQGWYCVSCKVDIPSLHNTYGITGKANVSKLPPTRTGFMRFASYAIDCRKTLTCSTCKGLAMLLDKRDVKVGDEVICTEVSGTKLKYNGVYKVHTVNADSFGLDVGGIIKNFSRCRFNIRIGQHA